MLIDFGRRRETTALRACLNFAFKLHFGFTFEKKQLKVPGKIWFWPFWPFFGQKYIACGDIIGFFYHFWSPAERLGPIKSLSSVRPFVRPVEI